MCIIRTQPRGYRKKPMGSLEQRLFRAAFRKHPVVAERTITRGPWESLGLGGFGNLEGNGSVGDRGLGELELAEPRFQGLYVAAYLGLARLVGAHEGVVVGGLV